MHSQFQKKVIDEKMTPQIQKRHFYSKLRVSINTHEAIQYPPSHSMANRVCLAAP